MDVFAVGLIAYWLLTGKKAELSDLELASSLQLRLHPHREDFAKSLERNKEERYQSCKGALIGLKATEAETGLEETGFIQRQIDRIPVPKPVVERGYLATRVYRLSLIGLIGVTLTAMMTSFFKRVLLDEEEPAAPMVAAVRVFDDGPANVQLTIVPEQARLQIHGQDQAYRTKKGTLRLQITEGAYQLRYRQKGMCLKLLAFESERDARMYIGRLHWWQNPVALTVYSEPLSEVVMVDAEGGEQLLGETNASGTLNLPDFERVGSYKVVVRKHEYSTFTLDEYTFSKGEETEIHAPLKALFTSLTVRSDPEGARVYVENAEVGLTPLMIRAVEIGKSYRVSLRKKGYRTIAEEVHIRDEGQSVLDFGQLARRTGSVDVSIEFVGAEPADVPSLLSDLEIELNGLRIPYAADELQGLDAGEYRLQVWHPLYTAEPFKLSVRDREVAQRMLRLQPRPGQLQCYCRRKCRPVFT